jgi:phosphoglycerate dehydrogenase-like enzyme
MQRTLDVLVYLRESSELYKQRLKDSDLVRYRFCASESEARQIIEQVDVILGSIHFPTHLLRHAHRLKWVQVTGAGVDAFLAANDFPEHVVLTRADLSFGDQMAEYVIGHLLAITQRVRDAHHLQQTKTWKPLKVEFLKGKTMGIAGTGSVGRAVAARAGGMGMKTIGLATTKRRIPEFSAVYAPESLSAFLSQLDVLVVCLPLTAATRGMLGTEQLALLKDSAILVNVARGAVFDESALGDALRRRLVRAAVLDVFEHEPLPANSPLWTMDNVTITSHHAGLNTPDDMIDFFLENFRRLRSGAPLNGVVDPRQGY